MYVISKTEVLVQSKKCQYLLKYNYLVNKYLISVLSDKPLSRCYLLLSHVQNSFHIWNSRVLNKPALYQEWQMHSQDVLFALNKENYKAAMMLLEGDLGTEVKYSTTADQSFTTTVSDLLFHHANETAISRSQVIEEFKGKGVSISSTDFLSFQRQQQ